MVYELRCYTLKPGKMPEYLKAAETISSAWEQGSRSPIR